MPASTFSLSIFEYSDVESGLIVDLFVEAFEALLTTGVSSLLSSPLSSLSPSSSSATSVSSSDRSSLHPPLSS